MKWYLFIEYGNCRYGDYMASLMEFDTRHEAEEKLAQYKKEQGLDLSWSLIEGTEVDRG